MNGSRRVARSDVVDVFERLGDPYEPLSTSEVAGVLGCARRTAYDRLDELAARDRLGTKLVGAGTRVWWLPVSRESGDGEDGVEGVDVAATAGEGLAASGLDELTSEEVLELEFRSEELARPFREIVGEGGASVAVDGVVGLPDGSHVQYWTIEGAPPAAIRALEERVPTDVSVRLVSKREGTCRVEVTSEGRSLVATLEKHGGAPVSTVLADEVVRLVAQFPATVDAGDLLTDVRDVLAADLELVSQRLVYTPRLFHSLVAEELTERQWTALRLAYYAGYYANPRETGGDTLAERMGITRQTFSYHRRRAETAVVATLFDLPAEAGTAPSDQEERPFRAVRRVRNGR
jgi:predicted DNA binding protein